MKNLQNKIRNTKGITLIALIITIIVLLILAGVVINMTIGNEGIISKSQSAAEMYNRKAAMEQMNLKITEIAMEKYEEGKFGDLTLQEIADGLAKDAGIEYVQGGQIASLDVTGYSSIYAKLKAYVYLFEIKSTKDIKIIEEEKITVTAEASQNWIGKTGTVTISGKIKSKSKNGVTGSIILGNESTNLTISSDGSYTYTADKAGIYTIKAMSGEYTKTVEVEIKSDTTAPTITKVEANVSRLTINLTAEATDDISGLKELSYSITPTNGLNKTSGTFKAGETETITSTQETTYTISVKAKDNAENETATASTATAKTMDAMTVEEAKATVTSKQKLKEYLGTKVAYSPSTDTTGTYRIFYYDYTDDGNGNGKFGPTGKLYLKRDFDEGLKITDSSYASYSASATGVSRMKAMNPKWRDYPTAGANTIDLRNERVVSFLCDSENAAWTKYGMSGVSEYVIGSPSVEMYMDAYNVYKNNDNYLICKMLNFYGNIRLWCWIKWFI